MQLLYEFLDLKLLLVIHGLLKSSLVALESSLQAAPIKTKIDLVLLVHLLIVKWFKLLTHKLWYLLLLVPNLLLGPI